MTHIRQFFGKAKFTVWDAARVKKAFQRKAALNIVFLQSILVGVGGFDIDILMFYVVLIQPFQRFFARAAL